MIGKNEARALDEAFHRLHAQGDVGLAKKTTIVRMTTDREHDRLFRLPNGTAVSTTGSRSSSNPFRFNCVTQTTTCNLCWRPACISVNDAMSHSPKQRSTIMNAIPQTLTIRAVLAILAAAGAVALVPFTGPVYAQTVPTAAASVISPHPTNFAGTAKDEAIRPFRINVPETVLVDLRRRLAATRWPDKETVNDESQGIRLAEMQALVHYWGTATTGARLKRS